MFEDLKRNLEQEKSIVADMKAIQNGLGADAGNQEFYLSSLRALAAQLGVLNNAVPELLKEWSPVLAAEKIAKEGTAKIGVEESKVKIKPVEKNTVRMSYVSPATKDKKLVTINKKDRRDFLKKLKFSEDALSGVKRLNDMKSGQMIVKPNAYVGFSNRFFRNFAEKLSPKFDSLSRDLKKANIRFLLSSYLAMMIMSSVIAFGIGMIVFVILMLFSLSNWIFILLPFGFVGLALAGFYFYPANEADTVQKNISYELPFATIHMSAIAGSNIEPVKILKIIAASTEYPNVGNEIRKVVTQIEIYGYDLVTALKNVSARVSNKRLSELFSGLATNISTGGALKNYLEKKSESFLTDYRLERQKYSALAGTFMDVYISILIAAPLVLMMMFIVMDVAGLGLGGLDIMTLLMLSVVAIVIVNIIFIIVINMKQPRV